MNVEIEIKKGLPKEQIEKFEDKVVYNVAVMTRETTKANNFYPYLTGELSRQEIKAPIQGSNKNYGLTSGVDYAKYVWKMSNANWTNKQTQPQWYYSAFSKQKEVITTAATIQAIKEIK